VTAGEICRGSCHFKQSQMNKKYVHLRSFSFEYEIANNGQVRKRTDTGYIYFERINEDNGVFVNIPKNGKPNKCLIAELLLYSFIPEYRPGYCIRYKDGNHHHIDIANLGYNKSTSMLNQKPVTKDKALIGYWKCDSRASTSNTRFAHLNQIITSNEILRCLMISGFNCFYCGSGLSCHTWQLDHFIPKSKNGRNEFSNLRVCCKRCNTMKSDMFYEEFVAKALDVVNHFKSHHPDHPIFTKIPNNQPTL